MNCNNNLYLYIIIIIIKMNKVFRNKLLLDYNINLY